MIYLSLLIFTTITANVIIHFCHNPNAVQQIFNADTSSTPARLTAFASSAAETVQHATNPCTETAVQTPQFPHRDNKPAITAPVPLTHPGNSIWRSNGVTILY